MWDLLVSVPDHCLSFYFYQVCSSNDPCLTLKYLMARSSLVPCDFVWEKVETIVCFFFFFFCVCVFFFFFQKLL